MAWRKIMKLVSHDPTRYNYDGILILLFLSLHIYDYNLVLIRYYPLYPEMEFIFELVSS